MIQASQSLPTVILYERHWDPEPKQVLQEALPALLEEGYDTVCFETSPTRTEADLIASVESEIVFGQQLLASAQQYLNQSHIQINDLSSVPYTPLSLLMRQYVSSKKYAEVAEKIKTLPAVLVLKEALHTARRLSFTIKGVDIKEIGAIASHDLSDRVDLLNERNTDREDTIVENVIRLSAQQRGIIFVCGAFHAKGIQERYEQKGRADQVLSYFPYSDKDYDENPEQRAILEQKVGPKHSFCLRTTSDRQHLLNTIVAEVRSHNTKYIREIEGGTSASKTLTAIFHLHFRAFIRPGYHVDALLETSTIDSEAIERIHGKLMRQNIPFHTILLDGIPYLVIPEINSPKMLNMLEVH